MPRSTATPSRLQAIVEANQPRVEALVREQPLESLLEQAREAPPARGFHQALAQPGMRLVAEVKRASPSAGLICADFDHRRLAATYAEAGADAVSVLTEELHFQGAPAFLPEARAIMDRPVLRKDFLVCAHQVAEARVWGADAVLLIVAILETDLLRALQDLAWQLGMDALVEVHDAAELDCALEADARLIGINNRNLHTFTVSLETTLTLRERVPDTCTLVSESGIKTRDDVERLEAAGVDAILVGETIARDPDPAGAIRRLLDR